MSIHSSTVFSLSDDATKEIIASDTALETDDVIREKLIDALIPGYQAEFSPNEADKAGAFLEDALSEADALSSTYDAPHFVPLSSPMRG
jgi:hypothetical protein